MTRKDYEAIAEILSAVAIEREHWQVPAPNTVFTVMRKLADYFAEENPRFNRERFVEACSYNDPKRSWNSGEWHD